MSHQKVKFVFFGGEPLGVPALDALKEAGLLPTLIVCNPDRPVGRKQVLTSPPVKVWAQEHGIEVWQPPSYQGEMGIKARTKLTAEPWDLFVVVAYNFILPNWLLELPAYNTINLHPSLLPKYRGASPIRSAILNDDKNAIGVSVMLLDEKMDHGPLLAQENYPVEDAKWPLSGPALDAALGAVGGALLARTIPAWTAGTITPQAQNHDDATYCGRLSKADGELTIDPHSLPSGPAARQMYCRIQALAGWPGTFFTYQNQRIKITAAHLAGEQLVITRIVPEGKGEQDFTTWLANKK